MLVAAIAAFGLAHAFVTGGPRGVIASGLGGILGLALLLWQFRCGLMGAGDVKLLGALGSWAGALGIVYIFVLGSILGGLLAAVWMLRLSRAQRSEVGRNLAGLARARTVRALSADAPPTLADPSARARGVPYGVALAAAGAVILSLGVGR